MSSHPLIISRDPKQLMGFQTCGLFPWFSLFLQGENSMCKYRNKVLCSGLMLANGYLAAEKCLDQRSLETELSTELPLKALGGLVWPTPNTDACSHLCEQTTPGGGNNTRVQFKFCSHTKHNL